MGATGALRWCGLGLLVGCGDGLGVREDRPDDSAVGVDGSDDSLAAGLWGAMADYPDWTVPDGWSTSPVESSEHVGLFVVRYDDPVLAAWDGVGSAPDGSISAKEEFDADGELVSFTAMQKIRGYDPAHGDWFWAKYEADGTVRAAGQVAVCFTCHEGAPQDHLHTDPP